MLKSKLFPTFPLLEIKSPSFSNVFAFLFKFNDKVSRNPWFSQVRKPVILGILNSHYSMLFATTFVRFLKNS